MSFEHAHTIYTRVFTRLFYIFLFFFEVPLLEEAKPHEGHNLPLAFTVHRPALEPESTDPQWPLAPLPFEFGSPGLD